MKSIGPVHPSLDRQLSPDERLMSADAVGGPLLKPRPRVELRKITYSPSLSQETNAYAADIYLDGKKVGTTENHGTGGADNWYIANPIALAAFNEFISAQPDVPSEYSPDEPFKMDAELYFGQLFEQWLEAKEDAKKERAIQKLAAKARALGAVLLVVSYPNSYSYQMCRGNVEQARAAIEKKYGTGGVVRVIQ